jgi:hypothetical protein
MAGRTLCENYKPEGTFWDYERNRWPLDKGMRLDHFLLSPTVCDRLVHGGVDRWVRGEENASDHAPAWICSVVDLRGDIGHESVKGRQMRRAWLHVRPLSGCGRDCQMSDYLDRSARGRGFRGLIDLHLATTADLSTARRVLSGLLARYREDRSLGSFSILLSLAEQHDLRHPSQLSVFRRSPPAPPAEDAATYTARTHDPARIW